MDIVSKIKEKEHEALLQQRMEWLSDKAAEICSINPNSGEYYDRVWLENNYKKILRNKRLINTIG